MMALLSHMASAQAYSVLLTLASARGPIKLKWPSACMAAELISFHLPMSGLVGHLLNFS